MLALVAMMMLTPIIINIIFLEYERSLVELAAYLSVFVACILGGTLLYLSSRTLLKLGHNKQDMAIRDALLSVSLFWLILSFLAAIVFWFALGISWIDALFEGVSGLTTTGATVLVGLDNMSKSILFFRMQLQWFGGMGLVVLAVAIIPLFGVGGGALFQGETSIFTSQNRLSSKVRHTASRLWVLYMALTIACGICYYIAGMNWFDALGHAMTTVSIGGFGMYDDNFGHFDSTAIKSIAIVFMCISGANYSLHFYALMRKTLTPYKDGEFLLYLSLLLIASSVIAGQMYYSDFSIIDGVFQAVSFSTTTGFTTIDVNRVPSLVILLFMLLPVFGACGGSTGGGLKLIRVLLIVKQGLHELFIILHPRAHHQLKISKQVIKPQVITAVWGFVSLYLLTLISTLFLLVAIGLDFTTAISASISSINNLGPGLGGVAHNYASLPDSAKGVLAMTMILGRLEFYSIIALFTTMFWRR